MAKHTGTVREFSNLTQKVVENEEAPPEEVAADETCGSCPNWRPISRLATFGECTLAAKWMTSAPFTTDRSSCSAWGTKV